MEIIEITSYFCFGCSIGIVFWAIIWPIKRYHRNKKMYEYIIFNGEKKKVVSECVLNHNDYKDINMLKYIAIFGYPTNLKRLDNGFVFFYDSFKEVVYFDKNGMYISHSYLSHDVLTKYN